MGDDRPEALECAQLAACDAVTHGFFTRRGGVSTGDYESLNVGFGSNDARAAIVANRARVADHLGVSSAALLTGFAFHSAEAHVVTKAWASNAEQPRCDALVTAHPGLAVAILSADCAPVLFADPVAGVVAAAHAGWKGALGGIVEATLEAMETVGANRNDVIATVGPCISLENYEVGEEFRTVFVSEDGDAEQFFSLPTPESRPHFDLSGYVAHRLKRAGAHKIAQKRACTYANRARFFSFRRATHQKDADYGRQISAILLK